MKLYKIPEKKTDVKEAYETDKTSNFKEIELGMKQLMVKNVNNASQGTYNISKKG